MPPPTPEWFVLWSDPQPGWGLVRGWARLTGPDDPIADYYVKHRNGRIIAAFTIATTETTCRPQPPHQPPYPACRSDAGSSSGTAPIPAT